MKTQVLADIPSLIHL